jgi:ABC-type nitrate/sulfonate/bicarbonate transport system substrate-binding protein
MKRTQALLTLSALAAASATPAGAQTKPKLRVAFPTLDLTAQVLYANDLGFYDRAGLDVEMLPLGNGAAIIAGVASGTIDIGLGNALTIEGAYKKGIPVTVIAPAAVMLVNSLSNLLLTAKNSPIRTAKDLNGKTIGATPLRGIGEIAVSAWIDKNGGDSTTVKYVEVPFSQTAAMLEAGRVDAAVCSEPFTTPARLTTRTLANPFAVFGDGSLITAFFALKPWAQAHPDLVARFAAVMRETAEWANNRANMDQSAEILAKYTKTDAAAVKATVRSRFATALSPTQFQTTIDVSARYKLLDASFPAAELIFSPAR